MRCESTGGSVVFEAKIDIEMEIGGVVGFAAAAKPEWTNEIFMHRNMPASEWIAGGRISFYGFVSCWYCVVCAWCRQHTRQSGSSLRSFFIPFYSEWKFFCLCDLTCDYGDALHSYVPVAGSLTWITRRLYLALALAIASLACIPAFRRRKLSARIARWWDLFSLFSLIFLRRFRISISFLCLLRFGIAY